MSSGAVGERTILLPDGRRVSFEMADEPGKAPLFVLGIRKSGSTIFNRVCGALGRLNAYHFVEVSDGFFKANIMAKTWIREPAIGGLLAGGNLYGGFRDMPLGIAGHPLFRDSRKLLLVRDPRDALVSQYFSYAFSHRIPKPTETSDEVTRALTDMRARVVAQGIDAAAVKAAPDFSRTMLGYAPLLAQATTRLLRYEDVILDKHRLLAAVCEHFGWTVSDAEAAAILRWADVRPQTEDPKAFIRKVTPGDHAEKLQPATIATLIDILAPAMAAFGYAQ